MVIKEPTTAAVTGEINVSQDSAPATIACPGLGSGETAAIEFSPDGTNWYQVKEGIDRQFTETINVYAVYSPGSYRVVKGVTSAAVGIFLLERYDI